MTVEEFLLRKTNKQTKRDIGMVGVPSAQNARIDPGRAVHLHRFDFLFFFTLTCSDKYKQSTSVRNKVLYVHAVTFTLLLK